MDGFASFEYISVSTINDGSGRGVGDAGEDDDVDGDDDECQEVGRRRKGNSGARQTSLGRNQQLRNSIGKQFSSKEKTFENDLPFEKELGNVKKVKKLRDASHHGEISSYEKSENPPKI